MGKATLTIKGFCDENSIGRSTFYKLVNMGKGPRVIKVGRKILITNESSAEWRRSMESTPDVGSAAGDESRAPSAPVPGRPARRKDRA